MEPGSTVRTDGLNSYREIEGYVHNRKVQRRLKHGEHLLPRVHRAVSLLKRWMLGTHQGAVRHEHLEDYLNEFVFRFSRRKSASRGKPQKAGVKKAAPRPAKPAPAPESARVHLQLKAEMKTRPRNPKKSVFTSGPTFVTLPMETHAFGFRLRANAPEGQKRFPISTSTVWRTRGPRAEAQCT